MDEVVNKTMAGADLRLPRARTIIIYSNGDCRGGAVPGVQDVDFHEGVVRTGVACDVDGHRFPFLRPSHPKLLDERHDGGKGL